MRQKFPGQIANAPQTTDNVVDIKCQLPPGQEMMTSISVVITKDGNALVYGPVENKPGSVPDPVIWGQLLAQGLLACIHMSKELNAKESSRIITPNINLPRIH